jgi:hypothetical protein
MEADSKYTNEVSAIAIKDFIAAQKAYRTRQIGNAQFLAAKKTYEAAMAEYGKACAAVVE